MDLPFFFKSIGEFYPKENVSRLPGKMKGVYALSRVEGVDEKGKRMFRVVYVGMSKRSIRGRLRSHLHSKEELWTHVSVYQMNDNIPEHMIREIEGVLRHIYRRDPNTNSINAARGYKAFRKLPRITITS